MLKAFFEGELRGCQERSRTDEEGKESIKYLTFIENEDGERLEVNSKTDYSNLKGKGGVASLGIYKRDGGGYWITLLEFVSKDIE